MPNQSARRIIVPMFPGLRTPSRANARRDASAVRGALNTGIRTVASESFEVLSIDMRSISAEDTMTARPPKGSRVE